MKHTKLIPLLLLLSLASAAWGQIDISKLRNLPSGSTPNSSRNGGIASMPTANNPADTSATRDTTKTLDMLDGIEYHVDIPDSVLQGSIFLFHRRPLEIKIFEVTHPDFNPTGAQFNDILDGFNGDYYLTVTELGHPHLSTFPTFDGGPSLAYRPNIFPGLYKTPDNIYFYQVQKPYTILGYNTSLNKDYQIQVTHTQNINERWNFSFDYHLLSPKGLFSNSSASDHLLDITTNYYSRDARYQLSAGIISQRFTLGENGGLADEDIYILRPPSNLSGVPMMDNSRMSEAKDRTIFVRQSFNTVRQFEWYRPIKETVTDTIVKHDTISFVLFDTVARDSVKHDSITTNISYALRDTIVGYDTIQPHKPHTYNTGVLALDLQWDKQRYTYADSTLYHQLSATLYWTNDAFSDYRWRNPLKLFFGIRPQLSWLQLDPMNYSTTRVSQQALYPFAKVELSPWPAADLTAFAEAAPNLSEYNLDAVLSFPQRDSLGNIIRKLTLRAVSKATSPELIYTAQGMRLNHQGATEFHTVGVNKIEADYTHPNLLDIHLAAQLIDHNIWFEEASGDDMSTIYQPCQSDKAALLLQGRVNFYLKFWSWLHYDMQHLVQYSGDQNQIRVPLFSSKNSIYADFYMFHRALRTQIGTDLRYHTAFMADGYDPSLGIFYRQNEVSVGNYLWADVFINLQVKRASLFLKAGHLNTFLESENHLILPHYPSKPFGLYFGLTWKFFD